MSKILVDFVEREGCFGAACSSPHLSAFRVTLTHLSCFSHTQRQLLRGAEKMPTPNRRNFVVRKTRKLVVVILFHGRMPRRPICHTSPWFSHNYNIVTINFTGTEFKANKHLTDPKEIEFCIRLADTNLDTVLIQAEHLTNLIRDPNYQTDVWEVTTKPQQNQLPQPDVHLSTTTLP